MSAQDVGAYGPDEAPQSQPTQGAPPNDIATRLQERQFLEFRYEQAMSLAIQNVKQTLMAQIAAGQQELAEDAYPADPTAQTDWMAGTRIGIADRTLPRQRVERRIQGAPDEVQQELIQSMEAQDLQGRIEEQGRFFGRRQGATAASALGAFGSGFIESATMAGDDSRTLYDLAEKYSEGQMPAAKVNMAPGNWLVEKTQPRARMGGEESIIPKDRQRDIFYEAAKKGYEEEVQKGGDAANYLRKAGHLAGFLPVGGTALKAGTAIGKGLVKGAMAVAGKQMGAKLAMAAGWAGATAAGGGFESQLPLSGDDQQILDKIRKDKGDETANKVEGQLIGLRFLQGAITWGTIEALGIPLGRLGTAGGKALPGASSAMKRVAAGAATGAALEPAAGATEVLTQEQYREIMGKDPQIKTAAARAWKVYRDPSSTDGERMEALKQAVQHMGVDAAMFGALHMAQQMNMVLPPSMKKVGQETVSKLEREARAELDTKTDLPREEINRIVPSPEEKPVEVPLAGKVGETVTEVAPGDPIRPAVPALKDAERRATEATEARKAEPEATEPVRRETVAEERRWIAEKRAEAEAEGRPEIAEELETYSRRFEDESRGEGFVPDPTRRPASSDELGKGPESTVRKALQEDVTEKTILKRLKKQHGLEAGDARKLILKERGARELREQQARSYEEGEGLSAQQAKDLQGGLEPGTKFRFRDLFEGRELTVTKNVAGGPVEVSDGDRRVTLIGPEFQRLDPQSIRKPEAAPAVALPAKPEAPAPTLAARPEALEVPWSVTTGKGKPKPVRVTHEEGKVYADVMLGKGDRHRFQGDSLAAVEVQVQAWAKEKGLEVVPSAIPCPSCGRETPHAMQARGGFEKWHGIKRARCLECRTVHDVAAKTPDAGYLAPASDVGKLASEAARAQETIAAHEAKKVEGERTKAQEKREVAEQQRSPEGVDALVKMLRSMPRSEAMAKFKAMPPEQRAEVSKFSAENPEAGIANVGQLVHTVSDTLIGPPRGAKDPRGRESEKQLHSLFLGNRPWARFKDAIDRFTGNVFNVGHIVSDRLRNLGMTSLNRRKRIKLDMIQRVEPAMREIPREEEGNALAFNWLDRHDPQDIKDMRDWATANKYDPDKVETALHVIRSEFQRMRLEMNRNHWAYLNARKQFKLTRKELRKGGHTPAQLAALKQREADLAKEVVSLRNAGYEEYAHRAWDPKTTGEYGGKVRKVLDKKDAVPTKKTHRAMLHRTGATGYAEDVFISADRYFMGMVDAIEGTKTLREFDPLINGHPRRIGEKRQDKGGRWIDPLEHKKPGEQFWLGKGAMGEKQLLEWVKWDPQTGLATLRRFDSKAEIQLPENLARSLFRKEGGLLALARMRNSTKWRADAVEKFVDQHIMGRWVDPGLAHNIAAKITASIRWVETHTVLGALLGNITKTPGKAFMLGHYAGMSDAGVASYADAMFRYARDPALRQLVKESGAADPSFVDTQAFSEKRVFRGKARRAGEAISAADLSLLRAGEAHTRAVSAAHGILEMQAWGKRTGTKITKADLYEAASVAAMRAQGNFEGGAAGLMFTGNWGWLAKTAFQFQRPAMAFFDTVLTRAFKQNDWKPVIRAAVYSAIIGGIYRLVTQSIFGTEHDVMQDAGVTVGETPFGDYLEQKVGRWTRDVQIVPGWPTNSFAEAPISWETWDNLKDSVLEARPELAAEALSGTLYGPQVKRMRQYASARPRVGKVGEKVEEVDVPHAATVGEALTPWDKFTGQSGQRMPEKEAFWRMLLPGASTRGQEAFTMRDKLKGMAEEVHDLNLKRNQALLNMRRSIREGRKEDADVFKAEYLQLKAKTGKGSDMAGIRESEQWEKLPPEVRQLANVSRQARMQMVTEVLEDPSSPYSAATRKDIIRALEKSETYAEGTTSEVRHRYRAARSKFLAAKE